MAILGVVVRCRRSDLPEVQCALRALPGVEVAEREDLADGRTVVVIEDSAHTSAAATLGQIALWPSVLNTSLVYEYSGPDLPSAFDGGTLYTDWRNSLAESATARGTDP